MTFIKMHIKCEFIHKMCGNSKKLHDKIEEVLKIDFQLILIKRELIFPSITTTIKATKELINEIKKER